MTIRYRNGLLAIAMVLALFASACGGGSSSSDTATSSDGDGSDAATEQTDSSDQADDGDAEGEDAGGGIETSQAPEVVESAQTEAPAGAPSGTLRVVDFSPVSTFDPAGCQTSQSSYMYPEYDTLTRQNADFTLSPSLATEWDSPEPNVWEFKLRDDVVFHDGAKFDAQVAADNLMRNKGFQGNPNASTWTNLASATAVDPTTLRVEFSAPQPQFPLQMSMVMGMMVSPNALDGDLSRAPAGSGPWIWQEAESQAGVTEVYTLNPDYWNPADQGVERIEVSAVADNAARLNAVLTGEADIAGTLRDNEVQGAKDGGMEVLSVNNYFPYIVIYGRDGNPEEALADEKVRLAIAYSIDREAYIEGVHASNGDGNGGIFPTSLPEWHVPELDDTFEYDPAKAKELLAEAGYPDGLTLTMPVMPAIQPPLDLIVQMLGASGITVQLDPINNGELGPRITNRDTREWGLSWNRDLLYHPADDLARFVDVNGRFNPGGLEDNADLSADLAEAAASGDLATMQKIYAEVATEMINRGVIVPLAHGAQNAAFDANKVTGVVLGLNMQAPMPYGIRVSG